MRGIKAYGEPATFGGTSIRHVAKFHQTMTFWFEVNGEIVDLREKIDATLIVQADLATLAVLVESAGGV